MFYAGIDWSDAHHDIAVIDEASNLVKQFRVLHSQEGLQELKTTLLSLAQGVEHLACIIETNHGLLITALLEAGFVVYPVNPKTVDRRRNVSGAKTDAIDAYLLAKTGRSDLADLRKLAPDSEVVAELKVLTRDQDGLIQSQTRLVNQLTACLKEYYPVALSLFSTLQQPSTLLFLQAYPTPEQAKAASADDIALLLRQQHYPNASASANRIFESLHQPQLMASPIITRAKSRLMLALVEQLLSLVKQIAQYDKAIEDLFLTHADNQLFRSLPRAGKRIAPRLLAEIGDDRSRYPNAANLQALAGTSPVTFQSGKYAKAHKRYACLKPLRQALYQFAWQSTLTEAWALAYYRRKRTEGKTHTVAVRALSNSWVRVLQAMWIPHTNYDPAIFETARQTHAPRAA